MTESRRSPNARRKQKRFSTGTQFNASVDYEPGTICWLKPKNEVLNDDQSIPQLPEGCYNHPAVVLWTEESGTKVTIFIITSFGDTPLDIRHPSNKPLRAQHLPIAPAQPHPDNGVLLEIDGEPLRTNSYIKTGEERVCSSRALRPHGNRKLNRASYQRLLSHAGASPPRPNSDIMQSPKPQRTFHAADGGPALHKQFQQESHVCVRQADHRNHTEPKKHHWDDSVEQSDSSWRSLADLESQSAVTTHQDARVYGTFPPPRRTQSISALPSPSTIDPSHQRSPSGDMATTLMSIIGVGAVVYMYFVFIKP